MSEKADYPAGLRKYILDSRIAFKNAQNTKPFDAVGSQGYQVGRSFYEPEMGRASYTTIRGRRFWTDNPKVEFPVNSSLPQYKGRYCGTWLDAQIQVVEQQGRVMEVLDIGCGSGRAAADIQEHFKKKGKTVNVHGITARLFKPLHIPEEQITVGDINQIWKYYKTNSFDVIYSTFTLGHTHQHIADHLQRLYPLLKSDGLGFLEFSSGMKAVFDGTGPDFLENGDRLKEWLKKMGFDIEIHSIKTHQGFDWITGISFKKTRENILVPVIPVFDAQNELIRIRYDQSHADRFERYLEIPV